MKVYFTDYYKCILDETICCSSFLLLICTSNILNEVQRSTYLRREERNILASKNRNKNNGSEEKGTTCMAAEWLAKLTREV
jgi:hypothetical protein